MAVYFCTPQGKYHIYLRDLNSFAFVNYPRYSAYMSPLALTPSSLADLSMFSDLLEVEERNWLATYHDPYLRKNTEGKRYQTRTDLLLFEQDG